MEIMEELRSGLLKIILTLNLSNFNLRSKKEISKHDLIIPLAAIVGAPACNREPELATQINLEQILNLAKLVGSNQRVLFPMTNSGYGVGQKDIYCDETTPLNPISHYGRTKVEAEKILLEQCNAITFRLSTVFGASPRMRLDLLINDFVHIDTKTD